MDGFAFYRQKRYDGGIRMGIEYVRHRSEGVIAHFREYATLLVDFQEGPPELRDVSLGSSVLWYLDLRCQGEEILYDPEGGRRWFLALEPSIREGLHRLADDIGFGPDDEAPIRWSESRDLPQGVKVELVMSAIRRVTGEEMRRIIRETGDNFGAYVSQLSPM